MRTLIAAACAALIAAPAFAQAPVAAAPDATAAPGVFQVLRATDKDMSCAQLSGEANTLNAALMQEQQVAQQAAVKKAQGKAMFGSLARAGLALGGQAGLMNGMMSNPLARGAFTAANQMAASAAQGGPAEAMAAPASMSPQQQRMNHLLALYTAKPC